MAGPIRTLLSAVARATLPQRPSVPPARTQPSPAPRDVFTPALARTLAAAAPVAPRPGSVVGEEEAAGYANLTPEEQQHYQQLHASMEGDPAAQAQLRALLATGQASEYLALETMLAEQPVDAEAQEALHTLLREGRLPGPQALDGSGNLLHQLHGLVGAGELVTGVATPQQLLGQVVKDIADPDRIVQGADDVYCGAVLSLSELALENPAEYARLVVGMGTEGKVTLAGGQELRVDPYALVLDDGRTATQKLLTSPLVDLANGAYADVAGDGSSTPREPLPGRPGFSPGDDVPPTPGVYRWDLAEMQGALTGRPHDSQRIPPADDPAHAQGVAEGRATVEEQVAAGSQPEVLVPNGDGTWHWVRVTEVDPAANSVTYVDPFTGQSVTTPYDAFMEEAGGVVFESAYSEAPPELVRPRNEPPGGGGSRGERESDGGAQG